jgi:twitching motility protein PilT
MSSLNELLKYAKDAEASDLHLVAGNPPLVRVHGALEPVKKASKLTGKEIEEMVMGILSEEQTDRFQKQKDLDFAYALDDGTRFRVNLHYEKSSPGLAARTISPEIPTMEDLLMPPVTSSFTELPHGLVLVTGPTGSGKSTTLATMINKINETRNENIITLEDPIEYVFQPVKSVIRQRELGADMVSFALGLKHILRQDPDVIMVGEMRDLETIAATLTAAETGHLVFATLHTYSAAQTIERIVDVFPPHQQTQVRMQLSSVLRAIVSQQLLPKKGGGRVAAREILLNNPAIANLIRENKITQIKNVLQTSLKEGMQTLTQDLRNLIKQGVVEKADASGYLVGGESLE